MMGKTDRRRKHITTTIFVLAIPFVIGCPYWFPAEGEVEYPLLNSEYEARHEIVEVFKNYNIQLEEDIQVQFIVNSGDSYWLSVDGYNDSLKVGYEHLLQVETDSISGYKFSTITEEALNDSGPYVLSVFPLQYDSEPTLEGLIIQFLDDLKTRGII